MARIKGILFDLGDTLIDFGPVDTRRVFLEGARRAYSYLKDLHQPVPAFRSFHRRQYWAIRWEYFKSHLVRREFNSLDVLGRLSRQMGQRLSPAQTEELAWLWYEPLGKRAAVEDGLTELLEGFCSEGLCLGLVSNTFVPGHVLDRHLGQLGLLEYFQVRIYSCEVSYRKPHPQIFRLALEELRLAPREVIFVGDSLSADVAGAARVGMVSVFKDPSGRRRHGRIRPSHRIATLDQLRRIVAGYNDPPPEAGPKT